MLVTSRLKRSTAPLDSIMRRTSSLAPSTKECLDRKSTRLNSSHTEIYTLSLHDALPISELLNARDLAIEAQHGPARLDHAANELACAQHEGMFRSEEHTSELQSHRDLHSFPTRRSSDLGIAECS